MKTDEPDLDLEFLANVYNPACLSDKVLDDIQKRYGRDFVSSTHIVRENLTHEEQQTLIANFPEYSLVFQSKVNHPHAYAAASRKLEYKTLVDRIGVSNRMSTPVGYDDLLCDVGGEFSFHLLNGHDHIHSCNPILDVRDAARFVSRSEQIYRSTLSEDFRHYLHEDRYASLLRFIDEPDYRNSITCNKLAQDCGRTARYGVCVHSSYDIGPSDFAAIMVRKNMTELYGSFIYSDIILMERNGVIPGINAHFSINHHRVTPLEWLDGHRCEKKIVVDDPSTYCNSTITFSFFGDNSLCYTHKLDNYLALVTMNYIVDKASGTTILIELLENRGGVQFFKMVKIDGSFPGSTLKHYLWLSSFKNKTRVNFFELDESAVASGDFKGAFVPVSFYVDTELLDKCIAHAYASTESKFRPVEIFNFLTAYNGRIFFGSDVCIRSKAMPVHLAMILANAIYIHVYRKKYDLGKVLQYLVNASQSDRKLAESDVLDKFRHEKFCPKKALNTDHSTWRLTRFAAQPVHAFLFWYKKSPVEAKKYFEETVSFVQCGDKIEAWEYSGVDRYNVEFRHTISAHSVLNSSKVFDFKNYMCELFEKYQDNRVKPGNFVLGPDYLKVVPSYELHNVIYEKSYLSNRNRLIDLVEDLPVYTLDQKPVFVSNLLLLGSDDGLDLDGLKVFRLDDAIFNVYNSSLLLKILKILAYFPIKTVILNGLGSLSVLDVVAVANSLKEDQRLFLSAHLNRFNCETISLLARTSSLVRGFMVLTSEIRDFKFLLAKLPDRTSPDNLTFSSVGFFWRDLALELKEGESLISTVKTLVDFNAGVKQRRDAFLERRRSSEFREYDLLSDLDDGSDSSEDFVSVGGDLPAYPSCLSSRSESYESVVSDFVNPSAVSSTCSSPICDFSLDDLPPPPDCLLSDVCFEDFAELLPPPEEDFVFLEVPSVPEFLLDRKVAVLPIPSAQVAILHDFLADLPKPADVKRGKLGVRREWLFADCDYPYGRRVLKPNASYASVAHLFVDYFSLPVQPNALLLVNYPIGSRGLSLHQDDESVHLNQQVVSFCLGADAKIVLSDLSDSIVAEFSTGDGTAYCFFNQDGFKHGVSGMIGDTERWAFTFRVFKSESVSSSPSFNLSPSSLVDHLLSPESTSPVVLPVVPPPSSSSLYPAAPLSKNTPSSRATRRTVDLGGDGNCLFHCLTGGDVDVANALRAYLLRNYPSQKEGDVFTYCAEDVPVECAAPGVHAGTSTIFAFCKVFHSNVCVLNFDNEVVFNCSEFLDPLYDISVVFYGRHYVRVNSCLVTDTQRFVFPVQPLDITLYLEVFQRSFERERGVFDRLLGRRVSLFGEGFYYNVLCNLCFQRSCECLHGVVGFVEQAVDKSLSDVLLLIHSNVPSLDQLFVFLGTRGFVRVLSIPGMSDKGYYFVLLSLGVGLKSYDYTANFHLLEHHTHGCVNCLSGRVVSPPYYNHVNQTYYYCRPCERVTFVGVFPPEVERVFRLSAKDATGNSLVDCASYVRVPVKMKRRGELCLDKNELRKVGVAIDSFFGHFGRSVVIGVDCSAVMDPRLVLDMFLSHTSRVFVRQYVPPAPSSGIHFSPSFVAEIDDNTYIVNSMIEAREYYRCTVQNVMSKLKPVYDNYLSMLSNPGFNGGANTVNNMNDFCLIDMNSATYIIPPKDMGGPYMCVFDGKRLIDISDAHSRKFFDRKYYKDCSWLLPGKYKGYMAACKDTRIVNSNKIHAFLNSYDLQNFSRNFNLELIEGVPGCGKTHYIINHHKFSLNDTDEVVLTSSKEAANDLRRRVAKTFKVDPENPILKRKYRTVDSFLINFRNCRYTIGTIWLDEGLMRHFGDVLWCAHISGCHNIKIIGDRAQIPFTNRLAGVSLKYSEAKLSDAVMPVTFLSVTYRCPVDIAVHLNRFKEYTSDVRSNSSVRRSVKTISINNIADIYNGYKDYRILTFTQNEKDTISKATTARVSTINEFQGNQAENILLVRLNNKEIPVFNNRSHWLVGISRHTKNFVYASVVNDKLYQTLSSPISETELDKSSTLTAGGVVLGRTITGQVPIYNVVPHPASLLDLLKQDRVIRDFVQDNVGSAFAPMRLNLCEVSVTPLTIPVAPPYYVSDPITTIQYAYDMIFPGQSLQNHSFDNDIFLQDDLYFSVKENLVLSSYEKVRGPAYDALCPSLRTSCPTVVTNNTKHVLKAFYDRNGNVPELQGIVDDDKLSDLMLENFVKAYIADRELFASFEEEPVDVNVDSIEDWLFTQPPGTKKKAFTEDYGGIFVKELNSYNLILKKLPKPKLEKGAEFKFPSPQTIAHSTKDINAVFCPIARELKKRLLAVLRPNVLIFTDTSVDEFEELLTVRLPPSRLKFMQFMLENDFSKYDKSQNRTALMFEVKILLKLGFPPRLVPTWIFMHVYTKIRSQLTGFRAKVILQRKSGDALTFFGNTLFLMAVFVTTGEDEIIEMLVIYEMVVMCSGDDILAFLTRVLSVAHMTNEFAVRFNLESKLLNFRTPYFCSKFLFMTPWGKWVMVPDVIKVVTKLGRRDLVNFEHVEEYRISCLDVCKHFSNSLLYPMIDACMLDRYKLDFFTFGFLYSALYHAFSSPAVFRTFFFERDGALIDHSRKFTKLNDF